VIGFVENFQRREEEAAGVAQATVSFGHPMYSLIHCEN
jgi:hypothetical protein